MADSRLSELTAATSVGASDLLYLVQSSTSKRITTSNLIAGLTQVKSAPANNKGTTGDVKGMLAFSNTHLYVCITSYTDGTANIWKRTSISDW
jgi:hypothetical protein